MVINFQSFAVICTHALYTHMHARVHNIVVQYYHLELYNSSVEGHTTVKPELVNC